jgi:hypothetical protein
MTMKTDMQPNVTITVFYVLLLVAVIFGVDFLFFRNRFWERLIVGLRLFQNSCRRRPLLTSILNK